jgi:hypothetical protein
LANTQVLIWLAFVGVIARLPPRYRRAAFGTRRVIDPDRPRQFPTATDEERVDSVNACGDIAWQSLNTGVLRNAPTASGQAATQRAIRLFLSSTFRDMQAEREELLKRILPQVRKLCGQRGVSWNEADLRWGITEEQAQRGDVLPVCLAEIDRCRPFFLCLLGERYGWVPGPGRIPAEVRTRYLWLADHLDDSVTEMEVRHAVLNQPGQPLQHGPQLGHQLRQAELVQADALGLGLRQHGAVAQTAGDGRDLNVDLLHRPAEAAQFGEQAAELLGGLVRVRPDHQPRQGEAQPLDVAVARGTALDRRPQLAEDGHADADAVAAVAFLVRPLLNPVPAVDEILGGSCVEEVAPHGKPSSIWRRTASRL